MQARGGQDPRLFERPLDLSSMPCHFGRSAFSSKEEEDIANNLKRNLGPEYIRYVKTEHLERYTDPL